MHTETFATSGRFMLPDSTEYFCKVQEFSLDGAFFITEVDVHPEMKMVAYLDNVGRIECFVENIQPGAGFYVKFSLSPSRRERLHARLNQTDEARDFSISPEILRRHQRFTPKSSQSVLTFQDGRSYPCEISDVSLGGAAVTTKILPKIGMLVTLGKMHGKIVRHYPHGCGIQFTTLLDDFALKRLI